MSDIKTAYKLVALAVQQRLTEIHTDDLEVIEKVQRVKVNVKIFNKFVKFTQLTQAIDEYV